MMRVHSLLLTVACGVLLLSGCLPDDMPAYTSDGKTIVSVAKGPGTSDVLWTYDLESKKVVPYSDLHYARVFGDQVWAAGQRGWKRFDPAKKEFVQGPVELTDQDLRKAVPASNDGRKCLLLDRGKGNFDIWSFPEMKKEKAITLSRPLAAGGFWWLDIRISENFERKDLAGIDVFNPDAKKASSISREEAAKADPEYEGTPRYARISADGKALLLVFGDQGYFRFGVFDASTGKFLWGGDTERRMTGTPLVRENEVWTFNEVLPEKDPGNAPATSSAPSSTSAPSGKRGIALMRYTPGKGNDAQKAVGKMMLFYPIEADQFGDRFAPSPDGSHFVVLVNGGVTADMKLDRSSRLLFMPAKEGIREKDVQIVELKESK